MLNTGFNIQINTEQMTFQYGNDVFGPEIEKRKLSEIRKSLSDPYAEGPEIIYSVAMDVGKEKDREDLKKRNLLYGAMIFAKGHIGNEPIRSQGHVHSVSMSCNSSTPEVYEIWSGDAIIYMQEYDSDNPGRCIAVYAAAGNIVIVPPGWAHYTINANIDNEMTFGAWCVRDYGFNYVGVRAHGGLSYFPILESGKIQWLKNPKYSKSTLEIKKPREYSEFGIVKGIPIYTQYENNKGIFEFVYNPQSVKWENYIP